MSLLPNTSGGQNRGGSGVRRPAGAQALGTHWLKLEIHPDARWLLLIIETLKAAEMLVKEGFTVLPYCGADPVLCKRLEEVGCSAVMPLGAPMGSNQGLETRAMLEIIIQQAGAILGRGAIRHVDVNVAFFKRILRLNAQVRGAAASPPCARLRPILSSLRPATRCG